MSTEEIKTPQDISFMLGQIISRLDALERTSRDTYAAMQKSQAEERRELMEHVANYERACQTDRNDHEKRLQQLENWQAKVVVIGAVAGALAGIIGTRVATLLIK